MLFCESCRLLKQWPRGAQIRVRMGECTQCGDYVKCYDVPSALLKWRIPKDAPKPPTTMRDARGEDERWER